MIEINKINLVAIAKNITSTTFTLFAIKFNTVFIKSNIIKLNKTYFLI